MTALKLIHIEEPLLEFRFGQKLVYPRDGLFLYGPVDGGRPEINYGVIGTPAGIALLERWTQSVAGLIPPPPPRPRAKLIEPQHIAFPGFSAAYNSVWPIKPRTVITAIDGNALSDALHIANRYEAIKAAVDIYVTPLIAAAARMEDPPTFWFVVIPEDVYELGRPLSRVPVQEQIQGAVRMTRREALRLEEQHTLFGIDEAEAEVYQYATHFRRQLKARLLKDKIVTQIVRETTLAPSDFLKSNGGMNLVSKEYVASQAPDNPGVLVLSQFAGAAQELKSALIVNPYDIEATAAAIARAFAMPLDERKDRWNAMMAALRATTTGRRISCRRSPTKPKAAHSTKQRTKPAFPEPPVWAG